MKVAIVGLGHIARHQMNAIQQLPGAVDLVGAYDSDPAAAEKFGVACRFYTSLDDLIGNSNADVTIVSTSNSDHFATASRLLAAGRAVMVEKPVCENRDDLAGLVKLARTGKVFFHAAFHAAFGHELQWWAENRNRLADRFGPLQHFHMDFLDPYIERDGTVKRNASGLGGSWYDSGINALSVLERIADPSSISVDRGHMFHSPHIACAQISGSAHLSCSVGGEICTGEIHTNWTLGVNHKMTLLSYKRGTVILDHSGEQVAIQDGGAPEIISLQNGLARLTNHYVGVFRDLETAFAQHRDNIALSTQLHELLYAAVDELDRNRRANVLNLKRYLG